MDLEGLGPVGWVLGRLLGFHSSSSLGRGDPMVEKEKSMDYDIEAIAVVNIEINLRKLFESAGVVVKGLSELPTRPSVTERLKLLANGLKALEPDYRALREGFDREWDEIERAGIESDGGANGGSNGQ